MSNLKNISLQLYSVRQDAEIDFVKTIERVADAGFTGVEFAGFYGYTAAEMKEILKNYGLRAVSSHMDALNNVFQNIEYLNEIGAKNIVVPHSEFKNRDSVLDFAEKMNEAGKTYKENGITLSYHNHSHEFKKDEEECLLDVFFKNTEKDLVKMQLDVCWAEVAGINPKEYLEKYEGRSNTVHMKEVKSINPYMGAAIGSGIVDFKGIAAVLGNDFEYIVEQEEIETDKWEALKLSVEYLSSI